MSAVAEKTQTLAQLLAQGVEILHDRDRQRQQDEEDRKRELLKEWDQFCVDAREEIGALAVYMPTEPPDDFAGRKQGEKYQLCITPFMASSLFIRFARYEHGWRLQEKFYYHDYAFEVETEFTLSWDHDSDEQHWYVRNTHRVQTDSLPEAVALCQRASMEYKRLEAEAKVKPPPSYVRSQEPALELTDGERALVLALRQIREEQE